jgi:hypothetical protein
MTAVAVISAVILTECYVPLLAIRQSNDPQVSGSEPAALQTLMSSPRYKQLGVQTKVAI